MDSGGMDRLGESLVGDWSIIRYRKDADLVAPLHGTDPTVTFDEEHRLAIATGCNRVISTWEVDGTSITLGLLARTLMMCSEPAGVMEQEQALADAIGESVTVWSAQQELALLDADGSATIVAVRI